MSATPLEGQRAVVVGAGIGGLAAAVDLARFGASVTVFDRALTAGGKIRRFEIDNCKVDAGPTVVTLRDVFDSLFEDAGQRLDDALTLHQQTTLARHSWGDGQQLDLFTEVERSADAIGTFAGSREADGYLRFARDCEKMHDILSSRFMRASRPGVGQLIMRIGPHRVSDLLATRPFARLWAELHRYFNDPRLIQLFGRYATYCGCSPFESPATLMLIADVERRGVWTVEDGVAALPQSLQLLAESMGAQFRMNTGIVRLQISNKRVTGVTTATGEKVDADIVVFNGDKNALEKLVSDAPVAQLIKPTPPEARSLSAMVLNTVCATSGFELLHHNVFFSDNYKREFEQIFHEQRLPEQPTVYVCAQGRSSIPPPSRPDAAQRDALLCLINAPATIDADATAEATQSATATIEHELSRHGLSLSVQPQHVRITSPADFSRLFPATGGSLYGARLRDWHASFRRPGSRVAVTGLYLAGGSVHPGPGIPMSAISGRLAAGCAVEDRIAGRSPRGLGWRRD